MSLLKIPVSKLKTEWNFTIFLALMSFFEYKSMIDNVLNTNYEETLAYFH